MPPYLDRAGVEGAFADTAWQRVLFGEFAAALTSATRPFPCVFGTAGFKADQLRFAFPDPLDAASLADVLAAYLASARCFGANTSLVVIGRPGPVQSLSGDRDRFWTLLRDLAALDRGLWPPHIPPQIDTPGWEFCFGGEPVFVVCNTPAHVLRQSRRSSSFMLTFQPRWVFDRILGTPAAARGAFGTVRRHLGRYDMLPVSPALGHFGDRANREFAQYFLGDDNERAPCPFATLHTEAETIAC